MLMCEYLGGMAFKMHETHMSNVCEAAGANFEDDSFYMFDPQTFHNQPSRFGPFNLSSRLRRHPTTAKTMAAR
jgi:hypothetical protein